MQLSATIDQHKWFGVGDLDDCWVCSALMLVHAVTPWSRLVGTKAFRAGAGDPDDGNNDGGNVAEVIRGITTMYPAYAGKLTPMRKATWAPFTRAVDGGRPASVSLMTGRLPRRLQYQAATVAHQVTLARQGELHLGDPLAPVYSRWAVVTWEEIKDAILEYGRVRSGGTRSVYAVLGPTELEMLPTHPLFRQAAEASAAALVTAAQRDGFNAAVTAAAAISTDATARINALRRA